MTLSLPRLAVALAIAASALLVTQGCTHFNTHGRQGLPHVLRVVTVPPEAEVRFPDHGNLLYVTPADVDDRFDTSDRIVITKAGYERFEGTLGELDQVSSGTWEYRLVPLR